jgi:hypothetical protein
MKLFFKNATNEIKTKSKTRSSHSDSEDEELRQLKMKAKAIEKDELKTDLEKKRLKIDYDDALNRKKELFAIELDQVTKQRELDLLAADRAHKEDALRRSRHLEDRTWEESNNEMKAANKWRRDMITFSLQHSLTNRNNDIAAEILNKTLYGPLTQPPLAQLYNYPPAMSSLYSTQAYSANMNEVAGSSKLSSTVSATSASCMGPVQGGTGDDSNEIEKLKLEKELLYLKWKLREASKHDEE